MKTLDRKLIRDFKGSKGLFGAVTVIILLAVAFFGSMFMAAQNLSDSYDYSYDKLKFADFTVKAAEDASAATEMLQQIDGVTAVTARSNNDFTLNLPQTAKSEKVLARVISLPSDSGIRQNAVNDVYVNEGEYFPKKSGNFLLVEKNFADHHDLIPGQSLSLTVNGENIPFTISAIVTSPEYIFPAKSRQEMFVSANVWGVVFVSHETAVNILGQPINEFCFLTQEEFERDAVISAARKVLQPYRIMEVLEKEEQPSYDGLNMDLEQFNTLAELFPMLFIIVGAMATYILLTRIVYNQRTQIGLMRAVGYSRKKIMSHYLGFAFIIGTIGAILGSIAGYFFSEGITSYYASMINLPFTETSVQWDGLFIGFFLGFLPCLLAGLIPARAASNIPPAEAMRTPAPAAGRKLLLERLFPFLKKLPSAGKIPLRNIFRNRKRSFYTTVGVTFGVALILVSAGMIDSIDDWFDFTFNDIQRYDARIDFAEPQPAEIIDEISRWDGVEEIEPMLYFPARMQFEDKAYTTLTIALPSDGELRGLYTDSGTSTHTTLEGILLSNALEDELDIKRGDILELSTPLGLFQLPVAGFVKEPMGSFGYIPFEQVRLLTGGDGIVNGLFLRMPESAENTIREQAYDMEAVSSVELISEVKDEVDKLMEAGLAMLAIMLLFGATLAAAIVFTTVTVNLLERRREIATMRTLGESKRRINIMVTVENLILGISGLIPGIILGYLLTVYFFSLFQGDMFSMDVVIYDRSYLLAAGMVILIMLLSEMPSIRSLGRINLATATKEQGS